MIFDYDTEFYEDGERIHLISIGIVAEDGRELYMENYGFDWKMVPNDHWLHQNVRPHLEPYLFGVPRDYIRDHVGSFLTSKGKHNNELWGYYADYDHVVLAQLFGRMVDMPEGVPWFTLDIKQEAHRLGVAHLDEFVPQNSTEHHALNDARWNRKARLWLKNYEDSIGPQIW